VGNTPASQPKPQPTGPEKAPRPPSAQQSPWGHPGQANQGQPGQQSPWGHPGQANQGQPASYGTAPGSWPPGSAYWGPAKPKRQRATDRAGRPFADWWHRAAARLLDAVFVLMLIALVLGALSSSGILPGYTVEKVNQATGQVQLLHEVSAFGWIVAAFIASLIWLAYFALLDGSQSGHTIGKQALGLRVRDLDSGDQLGAARALLRELVILVCFWALLIPLVFDALSPLWDSQHRAWHDKLAGSVVVEEMASLPRQSPMSDPGHRLPPW